MSSAYKPCPGCGKMKTDDTFCNNYPCEYSKKEGLAVCKACNQPMKHFENLNASACMTPNCKYFGLAPGFEKEDSNLKKTDLGNDRSLNMDLLQKLSGMPIYGEVLRMITAQQEKGLEKYGELLTLNNYSFSEWIEHAQMECIDKLLYLEGIKQKALQLNKVIGNP